MTKKIVVHIVEDLKIGGLERVIENIVINLNKERYEPLVLCLTRGGEIADEIISKGVPVEILNIQNYHSISNILKVVKWLKFKKVDIVHTHGYPAGVLGRVAAIIARVPCIFHHIHGIYFYYTGRQIFIERLLSRFTSKIVTCSNAAKEFMAEIFRLQLDKMVTVYNGVYMNKSDNNADKIRDEFNIPTNCPVIGTIGRLEYIKGHEFLIKAAVKIEKVVPGTRFLIVGEGSLRNKLEDLCRLLGIKDIIFAGKRIDIGSLLSVMDVFVLPSISEGFGIAIIEAMAMGLPVVATKVGGVPEMVADGISGVLVPPEDQEALSQKIISLLKDREKAKKMGMEGKNIYLERFTVEDMIQSLEKLYITYF